MRLVLAGVIVASLAAPVFAQQQEHMQGYREPDKEKSPAQKAADKAATDAYQRSLGSIPDKGPSDPWGTMRSNDAPKAAPTKTSKAKTNARPE